MVQDIMLVMPSFRDDPIEPIPPATMPPAEDLTLEPLGYVRYRVVATVADMVGDQPAPENSLAQTVNADRVWNPRCRVANEGEHPIKPDHPPQMRQVFLAKLGVDFVPECKNLLTEGIVVDILESAGLLQGRVQ